MPVDIINIIDISLRRFVRVAKRLATFLCLPILSQSLLLKSPTLLAHFQAKNSTSILDGLCEMLTARALNRFDAKTASFRATTTRGIAPIHTNFFDCLECGSSQKAEFFQ